MAGTRSRRSSDEGILLGNQEPSERIAPNYSQTDGPDAAKLLEIGGLVLDPWQADVLDDWLAINAAGKWVCKSCGGSVPRQNGKTGIVTIQAENGSVIILPAPTREGYTFDYWEGSRYEAGYPSEPVSVG